MQAIPIDPLIVKRLSQLRPTYWLAAALGDWLIIAIAVTCCLTWSHWAVWVSAFLVIGNRQQALGVLMHDAVHYRLTGRHWSNDLISDFVCGYPVFMPTFNYRVFHLEHHVHLDTPRDPEGRFFEAFPKESRFPMHPLRFGWVILRDASGLWPCANKFLLSLLWGLPGQRKRELISIGLLHGTVAAFAYQFDSLHVYALLWLLPMYILFPVTFRVRAMAEHHGIDEAGPERYTRREPDTLRTTRTVKGWIGSTVFGPHYINYHVEHHLYPSVPFHNLPRLSEELTKAAPELVRPRIRPSYWAAIRACLGPTGKLETSRSGSLTRRVG